MADGLTKIIRFDDRAPTGEPTIQILSRESLDGVKLASEAAEYIKSVEPKPGKTIVLVLAMSAGEFFGPNRNGDAFAEKPVPGMVEPGETLPDHYKTFESGAHVYRHHCFPGETTVVMANRIRQPISQVQVGDLVATLHGPHVVTRVMDSAYEGAGVAIQLSGNYKTLTATAEHPVLVYRREQIHCDHKYNRLTKAKHAEHCTSYRLPIGEPHWVAASDIRKGDYLVLPKPMRGNKQIEPWFARLIGWVASEGNVSANGCFQFSFSKDNLEDIDSVISTLAEAGMRVGVTPTEYATVHIYASSQELANRVREYVKGVDSEKHLTGGILDWNRESLLNLLGAYIDGDGHVPASGKNRGQLRIRSSSPQMLHALSDIIRGLGAPATVQWDIPAGNTIVSPTNGKTYYGNGSGVVAVGRRFAPSVTLRSRKHKILKGRAASVTEHNGCYLVRVTKTNAVALRERVFNLEVEGPNHYLANEVVAHNCNKDPAKSIGNVLKAFYNWDMHRVELLLELDNDLASDIVEKINNGQFPAVSMGCKIRYDVCAICGNKAPTRAEYCDHAKYEMNRVYPDGRKSFVWNPSPQLFDISFVVRPADRIGFMMKKVAYDEPTELAAELGEKVADVQEKQSTLKKLSDIDKVIRGETADYAPRTRSLQSYCQSTLPTVMSNSPSLDAAALGELSQHPLPDALSTMGAMGIVPSTAEMMQLMVSRGAPGAQLPPQVLDRASGMSGQVLELLHQHPEILEAILHSGLLDVGPEKVQPELAQKLSSWMEKRSNFKEYLWRRSQPLLGDAHPDIGNWDAMTVTDPRSGAQYQTTRGAVDKADDANVERRLKTLAGAGLLAGAGYKVMTAHPGGKYMAPLALAAGALGLKGVNHLVNVPTINAGPRLTADKVTGMGWSNEVPINAEMQKAGSVGDVAWPLASSAAVTAMLAQEYNRKKEELGPEAAGQGFMGAASQTAAHHPAATFLAGLAGIGGVSNGLANVEKFIKRAEEDDGVKLAEVDLDGLAYWLGSSLF